MFDLNDFDETLPGPWEWDVKRLAVSMLIAAQNNDFAGKDQDQVVLDTVAAYRSAMTGFAAMKNLDVVVRPPRDGQRAEGIRLTAATQSGQEDREEPRQGAHEGQHGGILQTDPHRGRRGADRRPNRR